METEVLATITCDSCGKTWDRDSSEEGPEFMHLRADWGYRSENDLEVWVADLCEECVNRYLSPLVKFTKIQRLAFSSPTDLEIFHSQKPPLKS